MPTYAIGDVQGCYRQLQELLVLISFSPKSDRLWFVGDLVNRGPQSLEVLRQIKSFGKRAITVLGNHDIHLLSSAFVKGKGRQKDTFDEILQAPDRDELLHWLRQQRLFYYDKKLGFCMMHAGLAPQWSSKKAQKLAKEVEQVLSGPDYLDYLSSIYGDKPNVWTDELTGMDRLRCITSYFTRIRYCDKNGVMSFSEKGEPGSQSAPWQPWYSIKSRKSANLNIIFGHWSTHHLAKKNVRKYSVFPIDTGCLWGGSLTAIRLEDRKTFHLNCKDKNR